MKNTVGVFYNHDWSFGKWSQIYLANELFKIPKNTFIINIHEYTTFIFPEWSQKLPFCEFSKILLKNLSPYGMKEMNSGKYSRFK